MATPEPDSAFWTNLAAGLTLTGGFFLGIWRVARIPFKRIAALEELSQEHSNRISAMENHRIADSAAFTRLSEDHGKLRETLASQPTKDDLYKTEERISQQLSLLMNIVKARH